MSAVPLMEGALECSAAGVASSIYPDNARAASQVENMEEGTSHPAWPLLFDPQTGVKPLEAALFWRREWGCPVPNIKTTMQICNFDVPAMGVKNASASEHKIPKVSVSW